MATQALTGLQWLERSLTSLRKMRADQLGGYVEAPKGQPAVGPPAPGQLLAFVEETVEHLAGHAQISGAFAAHDGLILAKAGMSLDFEAFAATAQRLHKLCAAAGDTLALGDPQQFVLAGEQHKLALIFARDIDIGLVAPITVNIAEALASVAGPPPRRG